jgi:hypothetical protein
MTVPDGSTASQLNITQLGVCNMPSLTFLGIENPLGVLGQKIKGVINNQDQLNPIKNVIDDAFGVSKYRGLHQKYEFRVNCINQDVQKDLVKDTILNREYVLKLLKNKKYPYVRLAICSSLNSLLKYLDNYCGLNQADKFDTVIIYGHGAVGSLNMGLGPIGIKPYLPPGHDDHESRKKTRQVFGLDKDTFDDKTKKPEVRRIRDLSVENISVWTDAFIKIQSHVEPNEKTGFFHLFLMGCAVGADKEAKKPETTLQWAAAKALSKVISQSVCISAPTLKINDDHLDDLLKNIDQIREACAVEKDIGLQGEAKEKVPLVSHAV